MSQEKRVVYLEDLDNPAPVPTNTQNSDNASAATEAITSPTVVAKESQPSSSQTSPGQKPNAKDVNKSTTAVKRQRTLFEMMPGRANACDSSDNSAKKLKLTANSSFSTKACGNAPATNVQSLNSIPFSLAEYEAQLSEEERRLLQLELQTMGKSWLKVLKDEIRTPYFLKLKRFLWEEGVRGPDNSTTPAKVYPLPKNIYSWSNTPLGRVRVVIIGQDPYHGPGQAHGLCFSVEHGVAVPPSLQNIYKEIRNDYPEFVPPKHGNLSKWAENGILLLNATLTVKAREAGSHQKKGWEEFTDKVLSVVDKYGGANLPVTGAPVKSGVGRGIVFLAWGAWAFKRVSRLSKSKHLILTSAHPSPLSAFKNPGFFGNGHFKAANDWLENKYGKEGLVDWCTLD